MEEFEVVITETLQRKVKVQASSKREARRKVLDMYHYEEIVLNKKDFLIIQLKHYESNSRTNK